MNKDILAKFESAVAEERRRAAEAIRIERENSAGIHNALCEAQSREMRLQQHVETLAQNHKQEILAIKGEQEAWQKRQ